MSELSKEELIEALKIEKLPREQWGQGCSLGFKIAIDLAKRLPDTPKKVEVPRYIADLVEYTLDHNSIPCDIINNFYFNNEQFDIEEINLPKDILDLEKISEYLKFGFHRYKFECACIVGYKVETQWCVTFKDKEKNIWYFTNWTNGMDFDGSSMKRLAYQFKDRSQADLVAQLVNGEVEGV